MLEAGDKVHLSPKYWAEPEPGRFAIVEEPRFTSDPGPPAQGGRHQGALPLHAPDLIDD